MSETIYKIDVIETNGTLRIYGYNPAYVTLQEADSHSSTFIYDTCAANLIYGLRSLADGLARELECSEFLENASYGHPGAYFQSKPLVTKDREWLHDVLRRPKKGNPK